MTAVRYDSSVQVFQRITMDPDVMGGKPCIRGMRVTAGMIIEAHLPVDADTRRHAPCRASRYHCR